MNTHLTHSYFNAAGELVAVFFLLMILISSLFRKWESSLKKPFYMTTGILILLLLESGISWILDGVAIVNGSTYLLDAIRYILIGIDYVLYVALDDFFFLYLIASVQERREVSQSFQTRVILIFRVMLTVSLLTGFAFSTSYWTGWFFTMDAYGGIDVTAAYLPLTMLGSLGDLCSIILVVKERKTLGFSKTLTCLIYLISPIPLIYVDVTYRLASSYLFSALALFSIYIMVDIQQDQKLQEQKVQIAQSETEKLEMQVSLMMSQIQPHFLYNSLSAIVYLCRTDPKKAEQAVNEFADYLRMNLRSITNRQPIPFEAELNHAKTYLKIQEHRFPNQMTLIYDIQVQDFRVPALTLQPIVENAVKYAVETRFDPTTIWISTWQTENAYWITVRDNGPGFDPANPPQNNSTHIGIASVTSRLANMVNGTMTVDSVPGIGTTVTITIPKSGRNLDENSCC